MKSIITKYLEGRASDEEQKELLTWLRNKENSIDFNSFKLEWKKGLNKEQLPEGSKGSWNLIQDHLLHKSYNGWQSTRKINIFFRYAAILFFVISVGSAFFFISNSRFQTPVFYTSVVAENGQISKVELPDGSEVWLNSGSELSYSNLYAAENRKLNLNGEAYFQVNKNDEMPFVVCNGELRVKVLGTKFNVSAYNETETIEVVLETGKVELLSSEVESFQYTLNPGDRAIFNKTDRRLNVGVVNTAKYTSWKDGMIHIYDQTLEELAKRLEKRYNQKIIYSEEIKDFHFTFTIKNESLDEIIELMEKVTPIKGIQKDDIIEFKIDKNRKRDVEIK